MLHFFKYLFAIILVEVATTSLVLLNGITFELNSILKLSIPLIIIALIISLLLVSMTKAYSKDRFSSQIEKLHKETKKEIETIEKKAQKEILKDNAKANFKVGFDFAGLFGVGGLFILAQMMTMGLLAISATGGAMGGYYLRAKKDSKKQIKELGNRDKRLLE